MAHPLAGKPAPLDARANIPALISAYYTLQPDPSNADQRVAFGTSGHRGTSDRATFNEAHIAAIAQALVEHRAAAGIDGPCFIGKDTHALSEPALRTTLEVFAAAGVEVVIQVGQGHTPTPVISQAILTWSAGRSTGLADGIVITPSHNPPTDGGFKYNPPNGGPADTDVTGKVQQRANAILADGSRAVRRIPYAAALSAPTTHTRDFARAYVDGLADVVDMKAISAAGLRIGVDPMGGAGLAYWDVIADTYALSLEVVNRAVDPTFGFMTVDHDGKIRMDCSSPFAMAGLIGLKDRFDIAFGNDPDYDRHGIVTRGAGLMNPNHYLAVAIDYLFKHRPGWSPTAAVGKTLVSSAMIDRVAVRLGRRLVEVPVGFKYFVTGLMDGSLGFGGEESAGASYLRHNGGAWSTDKDGFILDLLAAEILAVTGRDPGEHHADLERAFGKAHYTRRDAPADPAQKRALANLSPAQVRAERMAGEAITAKLTRAPGNDAPIGGLKVCTENGWFAARPSGTENVYKIYAESFRGADHLEQVLAEAQTIVGDAFAAAGLS